MKYNMCVCVFKIYKINSVFQFHECIMNNKYRTLKCVYLRTVQYIQYRVEAFSPCIQDHI